MDLLGAWDYAVKDPDGVMGGALPEDEVGVAGFSMGAFTTLNAFGLEAKIPAAWTDGPPSSPRSVFEHGATGVMGSFAKYFTPAVWHNVEQAALAKNVDLDKNLPVPNLKKGPKTQRPLFLLGNEGDDTVPIREFDILMGELDSMPEKYSVTAWRTTKACKNAGTHCVTHFAETHEYELKLCYFWAAAFQEDVMAK